MTSLHALLDWEHPSLHRPGSRLYEWMFVFLLTMACMLVIVDLLVSVVVQTQIQGFLAIDDTKAQWIGKAFFFPAVITPLLAVYLANLVGYKRMLFVSIGIFLFGSLSTAFAWDYPLMLTSRALAGMGGGGVFSITLCFISHILPKEMRQEAQVLYSNAFFGFGITFGALLGGYFGDTYAWHIPFLINAPLGGIILLALLLVLPETEKRYRPPFDFFSYLTLSTCLFTLLLIMQEVKAPWNTEGWNSPFIWWCTALAFGSFALFLIACMTVREPLFKLELFFHPRFCIGVLGMLIIGLMIFGVVMDLIALLEHIYLYDRWTIGWFVSFVGLFYFFLGVVPAFLMRWVHPRVFVVVGMTLIAVSCFLNQNMTIQSSMYQIGIYLALRSAGIALALGPIIVLSLSGITRELIPKATAFLTFSRMIGAMFGSSLINLVMLIREPYHNLRFGEQVNVQSARFQRYLHDYGTYLKQSSGAAPTETSHQVKELLIANINGQAQIASFNDAVYILGWATVAMTGIMVTFMIYRYWRGGHLRKREKEPELGF